MDYKQIFAITTEDKAGAKEAILKRSMELGRQLTHDEIEDVAILDRHERLTRRLIESDLIDNLPEGIQPRIGPKMRIAWRQSSTLSEVTKQMVKDKAPYEQFAFLNHAQDVLRALLRVWSPSFVQEARDSFWLRITEHSPQPSKSEKRLFDAIDQIIAGVMAEFPYCIHPQATSLVLALSSVPNPPRNEDGSINYNDESVQ